MIQIHEHIKIKMSARSKALNSKTKGNTSRGRDSSNE